MVTNAPGTERAAQPSLAEHEPQPTHSQRHRQQIEILLALTQTLRYPWRVTETAVQYYHRFWQRSVLLSSLLQPSNSADHRHYEHSPTILLAAIFLASKCEDAMRRSIDIIRAYHSLVSNNTAAVQHVSDSVSVSSETTVSSTSNEMNIDGDDDDDDDDGDEQPEVFNTSNSDNGILSSPTAPPHEDAPERRSEQLTDEESHLREQIFHAENEILFLCDFAFSFTNVTPLIVSLCRQIGSVPPQSSRVVTRTMTDAIRARVETLLIQSLSLLTLSMKSVTCVRYRPHTVAITCVTMAAEMCNLDLKSIIALNPLGEAIAPRTVTLTNANTECWYGGLVTERTSVEDCMAFIRSIDDSLPISAQQLLTALPPIIHTKTNARNGKPNDLIDAWNIRADYESLLASRKSELVAEESEAIKHRLAEKVRVEQKSQSSSAQSLSQSQPPSQSSIGQPTRFVTGSNRLVERKISPAHKQQQQSQSRHREVHRENDDYRRRDQLAIHAHQPSVDRKRSMQHEPHSHSHADAHSPQSKRSRTNEHSWNRERDRDRPRVRSPSSHSTSRSHSRDRDRSRSSHPLPMPPLPRRSRSPDRRERNGDTDPRNVRDWRRERNHSHSRSYSHTHSREASHSRAPSSQRSR